MLSLLPLVFTSLLAWSAAFHSPDLLGRQEPSPTTNLIDPVLQPFCNGSSCWHWGSSPPELCPLVQGPCANDSSASDNMSGDEPYLPKCGIMQYKRDCYCGLKTGLQCAWNCNWKTWWETEDWFAGICPDAPATKPIDFSRLPSCARECLDDAVFQYGCLTQTSNCFCAKGDLFDCHNKCGDGEEWRRIAEWLQDTCTITENAAMEALKSGSFSLSGVEEGEGAEVKASPPPLPPRKPLRWDEIFVLTAASLVGFVGLVSWVYDCWARRSFSKVSRD